VGLLLWLVPLLAGAGSVQAQADGPTGAVGGFVTDAADGQSLTGATVVLRLQLLALGVGGRASLPRCRAAYSPRRRTLRLRYRTDTPFSLWMP
jgi:hypothetical protein